MMIILQPLKVNDCFEYLTNGTAVSVSHCIIDFSQQQFYPRDLIRSSLELTTNYQHKLNLL